MLQAMQKNERIYVAGHRGLVGSAIVRRLKALGFDRLITRTHAELDLIRQDQVEKFFSENKIDRVFLAAARVGGIGANSRYQADFLYENMMIAGNVIKASADHGVSKLLFLGSSCIYPKQAPQPIQESSLLTGSLEDSNQGYAIAKIAGLKLCEMYQRQYGKRFVSAMPTNLYGPYDNFHPENSHVIPGMMRRVHEAKVKHLGKVKIWGTGQPYREFLHVDDLAVGLIQVMDVYEEPSLINLGTGIDGTVHELAMLMKKVVGFEGELEFDPSQPDGTPRKILDVSKASQIGWSAKISLADGLRSTYQWALENRAFEVN